MDLKKFFKSKFNIIFLLIVLILILFRIPSLFEPRWYGDEGIYAAVANEMSHGEKLYIDAWDHKPPAIYVLYWFADLFGNGNLFVVKLINLVAAIGTLILIKKIANKFFSEKVSLVASAIFAFLVGTTIFEGNIANAENFFMFFTTLGMYLYLMAGGWKQKAMSGLSFSAAVLFKIHPLFDFVALGFFVLVTATKNKDKIKQIFLDLIYIATPFIALQILVFVITGLGIGSFSEYIFTNVTYNLGYTSYTESVKTPSVFSFDSQVFRAGVTALIFLVSGGLFLKKWISEKLFLLILWMVGGLFAAFLSARPYAHYALQIVPAMTLLAGLFIWQVGQSKKIYFKIILALLPVILFTGVVLGFSPRAEVTDQAVTAKIDLSYYSNFLKKLTGSISEEEYNDVLDRKVTSTTELSAFLDEISDQDKRQADGRLNAYLWGNHAWFYDVVNVDNPSRYVVDFHIGGELGRRSELMYDLEREKPEFIIQESGTSLFDTEGNFLKEGQRGLREFVSEDYNLVGVDIGGRYMVYERVEK